MPPRIAVEVHEGHGPHLLLVHGMLASRAAWMRNLDSLAEVARPVVVELWGHGRSPSPDDPADYEPAGYVAELERVRASLGADRWFVCGLSLGGAIALRYALDVPDRVIGTIFTNSNSALGDAGYVARLAPLVEADAARIEADGRRVLERHPLNPGRGRRLPDDVRSALAADCAAHDPAGVARTFRHTVPTSSVRDRLHAHRRPALLVVGERERAFAEGRAFAESTIPGLRVVPADAGHAVNIEAAATFNDAVRSFVGEVVDSG